MSPSEIAIAAFIKPFVFLILIVLIGYPAKRLVEKNMKDGKLKRFLLRRVGE